MQVGEYEIAPWHNAALQPVSFMSQSNQQSRGGLEIKGRDYWNGVNTTPILTKVKTKYFHNSSSAGCHHQ
jgi:hypothetical protein